MYPYPVDSSRQKGENKQKKGPKGETKAKKGHGRLFGEDCVGRKGEEWICHTDELTDSNKYNQLTSYH